MTRRIERVNNLIRDEISEMLQRQVKDPRLGNFISITEVSTSTDLKYAKIFVSSIRTDEEKEKVLKALTAASGFFRSELAKRLRMRRVPELAFHWDDSIEHGARILEIMDKLHSDQKP
jgi:ribosome-binding factor A